MSNAPAAFGLLSKVEYQATEISTTEKYDAMSAEPLVDQHGATVVAVRRKGSPHFRRLGQSLPVLELPRKPRSVRHDALVRLMLKHLTTQRNAFRIFTNVFISEDTSNQDQQTLFALEQGHSFQWFSEQSIRFDDFTSIRPDLSGRDLSRIAPTATNPAVVIEIVDTHFPEIATLEKLIQLSRAAHHVYFFIFGDAMNDHAQKLNKFNISPHQPAELRVTWALINGQLVRNGVPQKVPAGTTKQQAQYLLKKITDQCKKYR